MHRSLPQPTQPQFVSRDGKIWRLKSEMHIKKVKTSNEGNDFIFKDYTTMTRSKLAYKKVNHNFNCIRVCK